VHTTTEWDRDLLRKTLQEIMDRGGLNQAEVGRLAGRDRTMANRWLAGQHRPAYASAISFANALAEQYPHLTSLSEQFLRAAGYQAPESQHEATRSERRPPDPEQALRMLRGIAKEESKTIGDVLVERGLATPEELTLSEEKENDRLVSDILQSNLPDRTKDILLLDYVERRRRAYKAQGLTPQRDEAGREA
jgi:transcriptional regulator with XRE-family HTH domain